LTPDQQDGVGGKNPAAVAEELVFSNSMPTSWKNGALPRMSSRKKIADYFGITVEELICYNSYKLKSRGKRQIK
jgi:hypothetical protein